ncbi:fimbrial-like protein [Providencia sp. PROV033]|uniref:fimbrial-like protein n=1 Tax=Providencia sp. PROV033 TaxID=2949765 RepID=UPI002348FE37|nr:fimbrial-like protein [Providencia sp. PROV033]
MTQAQKSLYSLLIPTVLYAAGMGQSAMAATTATTKISASIVGGGCQITAPATVAIRNGDLIPAEDITTTSDISETFDLTILGCKGYGLTPSITVEGDTNNASGKDLFVGVGSTSTGYGILLSTDGNSNFNKSDNLATDKKITAQTKEWNKTSASTLNGTLPLKAMVSCGDCTANNLQGGELTASVTFNFFYN